MTSHRLVVEGRITVRGNEPFTAVILQTENQNHYILRMSAEMRRELLTPAYRRVTGRLYLDQWNGRDYAHLEVFLLEKVPQRTGALSQKTSEVSSSSE